MGRRLDALFGKSSRQITKLKTLIGLTITRLAILRNQHQSRCAHARAGVAHLLLLSHHDRALLRAEMVIMEQNMLDVLEMVESYCHILTERSFLFQHQKECPEELREAAAGIAYAASRCGDLPELREVRRIFSSRFGKEFTTAAAELRNNCGVSSKMVQKLSTRQPSLECRVKVVKEIAMEKGIKVDLFDPSPETSEKNKNRAPPPAPVPLPSSIDAAQDLQELLGDEKLATMTLVKYKDAGTAAQAAFESAAYAAVAARTAVELYRCERNKPHGLKKNGSGNWELVEKKTKHNRSGGDHSPSGSSSSSMDIGYSKKMARSCRMEFEKTRGKGILYDESDIEAKEPPPSPPPPLEFGTKALVPVGRTQSFARFRERSFSPEIHFDYEREEEDLRSPSEKMEKMAIVAVKSPEESTEQQNFSSVGRSSFSVRTHK